MLGRPVRSFEPWSLDVPQWVGLPGLNLGLSLPSCVALGMLLALSGPQLPLLYPGNSIGLYLPGWGEELDETILVKH